MYIKFDAIDGLHFLLFLLHDSLSLFLIPYRIFNFPHKFPQSRDLPSLFSELRSLSPCFPFFSLFFPLPGLKSFAAELISFSQGRSHALFRLDTVLMAQLYRVESSESQAKSSVCDDTQALWRDNWQCVASRVIKGWRNWRGGKEFKGIRVRRS